MKLVALLIMLCAATVCQARNITIRAVDEPAAHVFRSIVEQTGKNFVYSSDLLKDLHVSVDVKNKSLRHTLSIVFKDTDIDYEIKGKNIILKKKAKPEKKRSESAAQLPKPFSVDISKDSEMLDEVVVVSRLEAPTVETAEIGAKKLSAAEITNTPVL
ncbi:MAG: STN domain-containing protein, partial [Muribaculaceae bacterium]|nr:STN domain-containing protein [Muribaculaceae bacterium]